jgi:hypothetical protein
MFAKQSVPFRSQCENKFFIIVKQLAVVISFSNIGQVAEIFLQWLVERLGRRVA